MENVELNVNPPVGNIRLRLSIHLFLACQT